MTTAELILWYFGSFLVFLVCVLAYWRRLALQLPVFVIYLTLSVVREPFIFWVYHTAGITSRFAFYSFWLTQALLLAARAVAIFELGWSAARHYAGFGILLKLTSFAVVLVILVPAGFMAAGNVSHLSSFVLGLERDFELTAAVLLFAFLALSARYDIGLPNVLRLIALGLLVYSLIQVLNNSISRNWVDAYFHWWAAVRAVSFHLMLLIWLVALWKPLPPVADTTPSQNLERIASVMRRGTDLAHDIAGRLTRLTKSVNR